MAGIKVSGKDIKIWNGRDRSDATNSNGNGCYQHSAIARLPGDRMKLQQVQLNIGLQQEIRILVYVLESGFCVRRLHQEDFDHDRM